MTDFRPKTTPAIMALLITGITARCKMRDGTVADTLTAITSSEVAILETTADFLFRLDPYQDAIKAMLARRPGRAA